MARRCYYDVALSTTVVEGEAGDLFIIARRAPCKDSPPACMNKFKLLGKMQSRTRGMKDVVENIVSLCAHLDISNSASHMFT